MINKRKPIRREVRCLYMALLKNNKGVRDLRKMIGFFDEYIDLRDRVTKNGGIIAASFRSNSIARSETVRLANQGLVNLYKENNIKKVG
ncbi:hypothetical protein LCGC14_1493730, partial [marine sediment metagenome]